MGHLLSYILNHLKTLLLYKLFNTLPLALCGDLGLRASTAGGVDHKRELHQRVTAISELVVRAVLHSRQLKHNKVTQIMLIMHFDLQKSHYIIAGFWFCSLQVSNT